MSFYFLLIFLFIANYSVQGQDTTAVTVVTAIDSETNKSIVLSCPGDHIDPPNCTKCATDYKLKDDKCLKLKNESKPSRSGGRRIFFIVIACLLTVILILSMLVVYGRVNQQRQRRLVANPRTISDPSNSNTNNRNHFNNILRSIGLHNLNKRGRSNLFSVSNNNNNSLGQQQTESSRAPLNENPDEALLFDDPYADGGFNSASANPYKSLTLAVT